ncbi:MAG TPA: vitamin B12 dependent-methionine synthase activation domain-containing protein, partial [Archangium sp.]
QVDEIKAFLREGRMEARAVFQFFKAGSDGNRIVLFDGNTGAQAAVFDFQREARAGGVCLADFVTPLKGGEPLDNLAMFVTTAGAGVRRLSDELKAQGEFFKMHAVQSLALESAEGYAELVHTQIRSMWGLGDKPDMTMQERFRAEYAGKRYSFGYPACPRLEDQTALFAALRPEEIGVRLTDGCMMEPEASVSAIVFHHPQAHYFSVV